LTSYENITTKQGLQSLKQRGGGLIFKRVEPFQSL